MRALVPRRARNPSPRELGFVGAGIIVFNGSLVLGITRGHDLSAIEIPGGTADDTDRSIRHTASREVYEETGVVTDPDKLVYVDESRQPNGIYVTFVSRTVLSWPEVFRSKPFEGYVGFYQPEAFQRSTSRYRDYTLGAMRKLGLDV